MVYCISRHWFTSEALDVDSRRMCPDCFRWIGIDAHRLVDDRISMILAKSKVRNISLRAGAATLRRHGEEAAAMDEASLDCCRPSKDPEASCLPIRPSTNILRLEGEDTFP